MRASKLFSLVLFVLAAFLLAMLPRGADAQNLAQLYKVSPQDGADLESAIREHAQWREQNGDPWTWEIYELATGENLGDFYIRSGGHSWADFDAYEQAEFSAAAFEHYAATMAPAVESISSWISETDTAHARIPESMENIQLFQVITWHLKPDKGQDFEDAIDKFHDAIVQTDWPVHYVFGSPVVGADGPQTSLVLFYENWAAFEGPEKEFGEMMAEVYGEEAGEIFQKFSGSIAWSESFVLRIRPDLSVNLGG